MPAHRRGRSGSLEPIRPETGKPPGGDDRETEEPAATSSSAGVPSGFASRLASHGPKIAPERSAHGDRPEEALALLQREAVRHQGPEQHRGEQVEDAEPDVEDLAGPLADGGRREHEQGVERQQADGEEEIGRGDEDQAAVPAHEQAEYRVDEERHDDGADEEPPDRLDAALHAQRLARRPHDHQRREDAEEKQPRDEGRTGLIAADVRKTL